MSNPPQPPSTAEPSHSPRLPYAPLSPWLCKYGGITRNAMHNFKNLDNTGPRQLHSGLAPIFPDLDARNYASTGPQLQNCTVIPKPSDSGLDQLFDTKRAQVQANHGMPTWEMAVLNEYLVNGWHGGHQSVGEMGPGPDADVLDHGFGVQVDEGKWHAVFERGKWFDFGMKILDGKFLPHWEVVGVTENNVWSVDNERVWKEMRVPLDVSNRWLKTWRTESG